MDEGGILINKTYELMMKDIPVLKFGINSGEFSVLDELHLPYPLKGAIRTYEEKEVYTKYDMTQIRVVTQSNVNVIVSFLASRVLPLTRKNAKKVYSFLQLDQAQDEWSKTKIALMCRAASLQDNYWVRELGEDKKWVEVSFWDRVPDEAIRQLALHGSTRLVPAEPTPELTGQGAYPKAWKREDDGFLWLYKRGADGNTESRLEVEVSAVLDKCSVDHVRYEAAYDQGNYCCKCKCMTTDKLSILPAMDFATYCNRNGLDFQAEVLRLDKAGFAKMCVVDYLVSNRDRHTQNWGFVYNCDTMEILGCHPLFDHNNAFDRDFMQEDNTQYQAFPGKTIKEAAEWGARNSDFYFTQLITHEDFVTERHYKSFMRRAKQLGIETKAKTINAF